mmetsp:Transcript_19149/g.13740  ORF Transcript_19149/g.13740 Transcript_19149/m.13740 type:complete len:242 (-) Transcript_19149:12-737(-)|eukprot:CAMPEP_0177719204 /NCGR_PEP_ID=MMETSP0484_2-20121128/15981_1 /TAXON_ID=354590 /ORGANISM="Rhodomonas lens, Strain RHODO" /LENGTH=241 /DNA_ID=CAMNT_0019231411 /DNA_START=11 /DNA_END=736 /DNA_ORIENTATION=+
MLRQVLAVALIGYAAAFAPGASFAGFKPALRSGACSQLRMVDWSDPADNQPYNGAGADRGQVNRSDKVWDATAQRLAEAQRIAAEKGLGAKSGLDKTGKLREGDRDPATGRLILDPLKIPTAEQGAPGSWAEYMAMRKAKEGVVKDAMGNEIENVKPTYEVQPGTWGAPKSVDKVNVDDLFEDKSVTGFQKVDTADVVDEQQEEWRRQREAERAEQEAAVEAKMAMWMKQAEEKRRAEGGM